MPIKRNTVRKVHIIILSFNTKERTLRCLKWLKLHTKYPEYEVLVIDNASTDGSREALRTIPNIELVENPINIGVSKGWNQGIEMIMHKYSLENKYIMLLNSDTLVALGWLTTLVKVMESDKKIGIVSYGDMTNPNRNILTDVDNISFVCPLIRSEVFKDIGLFEERLFVWHSDIIFCRKAIDAGWRVVVTPENLVYHFGASSYSALKQLEYLKEKDTKTANKIQKEINSRGIVR